MMPQKSSEEVAREILKICHSAPVLGIGGSRVIPPEAAAVIRWIVDSCPQQQIITGCARGADEVVRDRAPDAIVYRADSNQYAQIIDYRARLARRSTDCVLATVGAQGVWIGFPTGVCPLPIIPGERWASGGSGTWSSLALAHGSGARCLAWCKADVWPEWMQPLGRGWAMGIRECQGALF